MSEETFPISAYDLYIAGIKQIQREYNLTLAEAAELAKKQAQEAQGTEHLPFIEAAYLFLLEQQKH